MSVPRLTSSARWVVLLHRQSESMMVRLRCMPVVEYSNAYRRKLLLLSRIINILRLRAETFPLRRQIMTFQLYFLPRNYTFV
jgi:hypothetical protein